MMKILIYSYDEDINIFLVINWGYDEEMEKMMMNNYEELDDMEC